MSRAGIRHTRQWQLIRDQRVAIAQARNEPCSICTKPIDYTLTGRNPQGPAVDHLVALTDGGAPLDQINLAICHSSCNARKEQRRRKQLKLNASRRW